MITNGKKSTNYHRVGDSRSTVTENARYACSPVRGHFLPKFGKNIFGQISCKIREFPILLIFHTHIFGQKCLAPHRWLNSYTCANNTWTLNKNYTIYMCTSIEGTALKVLASKFLGVLEIITKYCRGSVCIMIRLWQQYTDRRNQAEMAKCAHP